MDEKLKLCPCGEMANTSGLNPVITPDSNPGFEGSNPSLGTKEKRCAICGVEWKLGHRCKPS